VPDSARSAPKRKESKCHATLGRSTCGHGSKHHMALGVHPRERKASVTRHLGGLLVGKVASAACALGLSQRPRPGIPSTRWRLAWRLGLPLAPRPNRSRASGLASRLAPLPSSSTTPPPNNAVYSKSSHSP
jgi:hypothetical protein